MHRQELIDQIFFKKSLLCVGLDTDPSRIPAHLQETEDPVFEFNKAIIDATHPYAIAYKINTAFYEAQGIAGWTSLQKTLDYIPDTVFTIADAKRGDIGNTSEQYARTFFQTYPFDSITVAPYMGEDSVRPFLQFDGKWTIVLGLTSNPGNQNFQLQNCDGQPLYEKVLSTVADWGTPENLMFVIGATQVEQLQQIRGMLPDHFLLIPGIGTQGGDVASVCKHARTSFGGLLMNVSRAIIYSSADRSFADKAADSAARYQQQMAKFL